MPTHDRPTPLLIVPKAISNKTFYFSITLVDLIMRKVKNKRKVETYRSYVFNLYKLHVRASKSRIKVVNKLNLK